MDICARCNGEGRVWDIAGDEIAFWYGRAGNTMRTVFRCDDCAGTGSIEAGAEYAGALLMATLGIFIEPAAASVPTMGALPKIGPLDPPKGE